MDARAGTPLTPSYSRDPSTAAASAAAANPSVGGVGLASAGAPPTIGLAHGLFMPPQMTSAAGGIAPAPARAAAPSSNLPNAARPKKMPLKILPTPSELHVMRCAMRRGRKIHLRRRKNRLPKMRTRTRNDVSFSFVY